MKTNHKNSSRQVSSLKTLNRVKDWKWMWPAEYSVLYDVFSETEKMKQETVKTRRMSDTKYTQWDQHKKIVVKYKRRQYVK